MLSRAEILQRIQAQKAALFSVSTAQELASWEQYGRQQQEKYGHFGLRYVPSDHMLAAIDELFARLNPTPGQRLVEIGPGPHGGLGLIAALMGIRVVMVEYDQPFQIDLDLMKQQLAAAPDTQSALDQIAHLSGTITVNPIDNLKRLLEPHRPFVKAAGGSISIVPGDFADAAVRQNVRSLGRIDHVVCTDVLNPMEGLLETTTAATTTGDSGRIRTIIEGLSEISGRARTLYIGVVVPEQNAEVKERVAAMYAALEQGLQQHDRATFCERVISPSSGSVLRSRLYHLVEPPATPPVYAEILRAEDRGFRYNSGFIRGEPPH